MAIELRNLSVKQKYKSLNPLLLKKLNFLDKNNILCDDLKNLISNFKFTIDIKEINNFKKNISNSIFNTSKVLKIIQNFVKIFIKKRFLIISFDLYFSDLFIEVKRNSINLYQLSNLSKIDFNESDINSDYEEA